MARKEKESPYPARIASDAKAEVVSDLARRLGLDEVEFQIKKNPGLHLIARLVACAQEAEPGKPLALELLSLALHPGELDGQGTLYGRDLCAELEGSDSVGACAAAVRMLRRGILARRMVDEHRKGWEADGGPIPSTEKAAAACAAQLVEIAYCVRTGRSDESEHGRINRLVAEEARDSLRVIAGTAKDDGADILGRLFGARGREFGVALGEAMEILDGLYKGLPGWLEREGEEFREDPVWSAVMAGVEARVALALLAGETLALEK